MAAKRARPPATKPAGRGARSREAAALTERTLAKRTRQARATEDAEKACCLVCDCDDTSKIAKESVVPACATCWERYSKGFTPDGSFEEVAAKLGEDEELAQQWESAGHVQAGTEAPKWFPHEVKQNKGVTVSVSRSMVGLTRQQLIEVLDGVAPEEVGIRLDNLKDPHGNVYKGLLLTNPARPYLEYTFTHQEGVFTSEKAMPDDVQMYEAQPEKTFGFKRSELESAKDVSGVLVKMKTMPYSMDVLKKRLEDYAAKKRQADEREDNDADDDEDDDKSPVKRSPSAKGSATSGVSPSVKRSGPVLNVSAFRDSTAASLYGQSRSRGTKPRRRSPEGAASSSVEHRTEEEEVVARKIAALSVDRILGNQSLGRELRWAKDAMNTLKPGTLSHNQLSDHIGTAKAAMVVAEGNIVNMDIGDLHDALRVLHQDGVDLPSKYKLQLLARKHSELIAGEPSAKGFIDMVKVTLPWKSKGSPESFDPLNPTLVLTDGSLKDKCITFKEYVLQGFLALVQLGEGGMPALMSSCKELVSLVDDEAPDDLEESDVDAVVGELLRLAHGMIAICDPSAVADKEAVEHLANLASSRAKEDKGTAAYALARALKNSKFYNTEKEHFLRYYEGTKKHKNSIQNFNERMSKESPKDFVDSGGMLELLGAIPTWVAEARHKSFSDVVSLGGRLLHNYLQSCNFSVGHVTSDKVAAMNADLKKVRELLCTAKSSMPEDASKWTSWEQTLAAAEVEVKRSVTAEDFTALAASVTKEVLWLESKREEIVACIECFEAHGAEAGAIQHAAGASVFRACVGLMEIAPVEEIELVLPIVRLLQGSELLSAQDKDAAGTTLKFFGKWAPLAAAMTEWTNLGADTLARKASPGAKESIKKITANAQLVAEHEELLTRCAVLQLEHKKACKTMLDAEEEIMKDEEPKVAGAIADLEPCAGGGDAVGAKWTDGLPEDTALHTEELVFDVATKTLLEMDGANFTELLNQCEAAVKSYRSWHDCFDKTMDAAEDQRLSDLLMLAKATKYQALMLHASLANAGNPMALKRAIKKYRASVEPAKDWCNDIVWSWCSRIAGYAAK